jgi:transcription elongation factor GreB
MASESNVEFEVEKRRVDAALRRVQLLLDSVVVAETPVETDKIAFGAAVLIRRASGEEECYQLVGVDEADPAQGRISWISPLARALIHRKAGNKVLFRSPGGDDVLTILKVEYPV